MAPKSIARAISLALLGTCVSCDQVTKSMAVDALEGAAPMDFASGTLRLAYAENRGAFLGLGDSWPESVRLTLFVAATALFLSAVLWIMLRHQTRLSTGSIGLALVVGGGIGNLIDRVRLGYVVDFLNVGIGSLRTGIFNVADMAIFGGAILIVVGELRRAPTVESAEPKAGP